MITRWSRSRTEPARRVERATIIRLGSEGQLVPQVAQALGLCEAAVRKWIKQGERVRAGRTGRCAALGSTLTLYS